VRSAKVVWAAVVLAVAFAVACGASRPRWRDPKLAKGARPFNYRHDVQIVEATNGLRILLLPDDNTNLIRVDVRYRVGAAEDPDGREGLAHLVEHLTYQVRPDGPDQPGIGDSLGAVALYYNAYTNWDETHYTATAAPDNLDTLLHQEAYRLRANCDQLSAADFEREREVVRQEVQQRSGRAAALRALLLSAFYERGHAYARPVAGTDVGLAAVTRDDACAFLRDYYAPERAILVVSGAIDVPDTTVRLNKIFGPIPERTAAPRAQVAAPVLGGSESWHELDVEEATAFIAFSAPVFTDEEATPERLLRLMFAGWLYELDRDNDFISDVAVISFGGYRAPLVVFAVSVRDRKRIEEAVRLVFERRDAFIEDLNKSTVTAVSINGTRMFALINSARAGLVAAVEPFSSRASLFADYLQYSDHYAFAIAALRQLSEVSLTMLRGRAPDYFDKTQSHVAYVLPHPRAKARAQRAELHFDAKDYDLREWRLPVDASEAERDLVAPGRNQAVDIREISLDNGMRVLLLPNLAYPVLDARLVFPVGTLDDPEDKPGVAQLAGDLLSEDFSVELTAPQIEELKTVLRMGGTANVAVDTRATTFRVSGLSHYADGLLWRLNWLVESGVYDKKDLAKLRDYSASDYEKEVKSAARLRAYSEAIYGVRHPYARERADSKTRAAIRKSDLNSFRDRHYHARGATLIIAGQFDVADVEKRVRRLFGSWSGSAPAAPVEIPPAKPPAAGKRFARVDEDLSQVTVALLRALDSGVTTDHAERLVAKWMIEERVSALREALGATYGVTVSLSSREGPGLLSISASLDAERAGEAFVALRDALAKLRDGEELDESFVRARRRALEVVLASTVDSESVADELRFMALHDVPLNYYDALARRVGKMRPSDVRPLLEDILDFDRAVVVAEGPEAAVTAMYEAAAISAVDRVE
jgi:zinc protease